MGDIAADKADRGDRAGTLAIVTPLWSYSYLGDTEARDTEEGFSSASYTIGSTSSDSPRLEGHHGQVGASAQVCSVRGLVPTEEG